MARRKKEPEGFHRSQIATAAERLFRKQGITCTTMDEVAKEAGYSKATLYVYFKNKEEIIGALVLNSMQMLHKHIQTALAGHRETKHKYDALCKELVKYQKEFPFYFETALGEIGIESEEAEDFSVEKKTFEIGELVNREAAVLIRAGMERGELRCDLDIIQTVFTFWAGLSGIILMADRKEAYIKNMLHKTKEEFMTAGFDLFYRSIAK